MPTLGLLAVGQTPRKDFTPLIRSIVGPDCTVVEKGVLDGISREEIDAMAPSSDEHPVISHLADGSTAVLSKPLMTGLLNERLCEFQRQAVDLVAIMCTGEFHGITAPDGLRVINGKAVIDGCVQAVVPHGARLGVIVPLPSQRKFTKDKFAAMGYDVTITAANPYGDMRDFEEAASRLSGCAATVLHCMGYGPAHRSRAASMTGAPCLCSAALVGRVASEILEGLK